MTGADPSQKAILTWIGRFGSETVCQSRKRALTSLSQGSPFHCQANAKPTLLGTRLDRA
jgi:hypothetical protein